MPNGSQNPVVSASAASPKATATLTPEEFLRQIRALREQVQIPELGVVVQASPRRRLAHVDADFVIASVNAVGVAPAAQAALGRSDTELRQEIVDDGLWRATIDEVRSLLAGLIAANLIRRQRIGLAALQTYQICKQLVRDGGQDPRLVSHLAEMKRLNKFRRIRRPEEAPKEPTPAPDVEAAKKK